MSEKIERLKENIEILIFRAKKFSFKNDQNIKDYLGQKDYFKYLENTSKIKGLERARRYYEKNIPKIIDRCFREEIKKYSFTSQDIPLKKITYEFRLFKEKLKKELNLL